MLRARNWDADPVVIVVAPTGAEVTRAMQPALPHTPNEIAASAVECAAAGAAAVHLHVREPDGRPSANPDYFRQTIERIRRQSDMITMVSTGGSVDMTVEERLSGLEAAPYLAGIETGSLNFGDDLFLTSRPQSLHIAKAAADRCIPLEVEAFELGHIHAAIRMIEAGELSGGFRVNLVFGVPGGIDASPDSLTAMHRALPAGIPWTVTAIGRHQRRMLSLGILLGATGVRVGFEDNIYVRKGQLARSNAELVEQIADLTRSLGRQIATCAEARSLFQLN